MRTSWFCVVVVTCLVGCGSSSDPVDTSADTDLTPDTDTDSSGGDALDGDAHDGDASGGDAGGDAAPTTCTAGSTVACYDGPAGTSANAPCAAGMRTCNATGEAWGPCEGQVLPVVEICGNGLDDDCNGIADDVTDDDGDGWTRCDNDCCETEAQCPHPALVNPGALEFPGDDIDQDCNPATTTDLSCDSGLLSNSIDLADYARALGLCVFTTQNAPLASRTWGVLATGLALPSGSGTPAYNSHAIRSSYGSGLSPTGGAAFVLLSTGAAADTTQSSPAYVAPQPGSMGALTSTVPADWLAANNGGFPVLAPGCPKPDAGTVYDPVMLQFQVRVPTNATSVSIDFNFYSAEFPEWVCSKFNDVFVALLDSTASGNPADKNIATLSTGPTTYPISTSLAYGNSGYFTQCTNGATGCEALAVDGNISTCSGTSQLSGTGYDASVTTCGAFRTAGGASGWNTISGAVTPGEIITLRFAIWDAADNQLDSLVVLDNLRWGLQL